MHCEMRERVFPAFLYFLLQEFCKAAGPVNLLKVCLPAEYSEESVMKPLSKDRIFLPNIFFEVPPSNPLNKDRKTGKTEA